jgi:hypothetical protein
LTVTGGTGTTTQGTVTLDGDSLILQEGGAALDCSTGDQYLTTDASGVIACGTDDGGAVGADAVGTAELDDDANTPTAGDFVVVETGDASFDYLTPDAGTDVTADLEEEAHVAEHEEDGADELMGEALGTACTENQILKANASGGLDCAADATGGSPTFDAIATGTNTTATMTVGTGASIVASGSGAITATGVAADSVALTTDTTGDYVSSATASQGLTVTGTEGSSVGVQDCAANEILKRNAGDTAWECAADSTGGTPSFDAVTSGTNTTAALVVGSGASLRSTAGILGLPNGTTNPGTCTEGDAFWDTDDDELNLCSATDTWTPITGGGSSEWTDSGAAGTLTPNDSDDDVQEDASTPTWQLAAAGHIGTDTRLRVGDADSDANSACISNSSDSLYHDTDCDGTKDAGEEFIDQTSGGDASPYSQYDPNNPPSTCAFCEEFTGDAEALTWRWGNQGTTALTLIHDTAVMSDTPSGQQQRVRWTTGPSSGSDFTATISCAWAGPTVTGSSACNLYVLATGDETTPTLIYAIDALSTDFRYYTRSSYTSTASNSSSFGESSTDREMLASGIPACFQFRYTASTKDLSAYVSPNCMDWILTLSKTLAAHPTSSIGYGISGATNDPKARFRWFRIRTDADGLAGDVGE